MPILINLQAVQLEQDSEREPRSAVIFDLQGAGTAEYRLTELDQADPVGRYRLQVTGGALEIHRATAANWADYEVMVTVDADGVTLDTPDDQQLQALQALHFEIAQLRDVVDLLTS